MADEGQTGVKKIERLSKGDKTRTALHAQVMNEIIDAINALRSATVKPDNTGKFHFSDSNTVLELTGMKTLDLTVCIDGSPQTVTFFVKG
jgi:hypothetical protein